MVSTWTVPNADAIGDLIKSEATLNQHGHHSSNAPSHPVYMLLLDFSFAAPRLEERDGVLHQVTWPPQAPEGPEWAKAGYTPERVASSRCSGIFSYQQCSSCASSI